MLSISEDQMRLLSMAATDEFAKRVATHLEACFPEYCEHRSPSQLREAVGRGIRKAASHGLQSQRDVCKFIDIMAMFGDGFDVDGRLGWAQDILLDPSLDDPVTRFHMLWEAATAADAQRDGF